MNDPTTDQLFLLDEVHTIEGSDIYPSRLETSGRAFQLLKSNEGSTIAAASFLGSGKIVVVGHEAVAKRNPGTEDSPQFIRNIFKWMTLKSKAARIGILSNGYDILKSNLTKSGFQANVITPTQLSTIGAIFTDVYTRYSQQDLIRIQAFVQSGGGMMVVGHNWHFKYPWVNDILFGCGIFITTYGGGGFQAYQTSPPSPSTSVKTIINGIDEIDHQGGLPSHMLAFGRKTFVVAADDDRATVVGAHYDAGRVLHVGQEGMVDARNRAGDSLVKNMVKWLTGRNNAATKFGIMVPYYTEFRSKLKEEGFKVVDVSINDDFSDLAGLFTDCYHQYSPEQIGNIYEFVSAGGGLLTGGHNWYYKHMWASDIVIPAGMFITDNYCNTKYPISHHVSARQDLLNVTLGMQAVNNHVGGSIALQHNDMMSIMKNLKYASYTIPSNIAKTFHDEENVFLKNSTPVIPSYGSPISEEFQPLEALYIFISGAMVNREPPSSIKPHPAAGVFPGNVPKTMVPTTKTLTIDGTFKGQPSWLPSSELPVWRSTGLYAAPGERISVSVPSQFAGNGLKVLIGAHSDDLHGLTTFKRYPMITRIFDITNSVTEAANAFGGLVYILVPSGSVLGSITLTVDGAYQSPMYVSGVTTDEQWRLSLAQFPVPFCELVREKKMIITIPTSGAAERVHKPAQLMNIYSECVTLIDQMTGLTNKRQREERFVLDVQISAGYMHAGYPLMAQTISTYIYDIQQIPITGLWGPFHEVGHQFQFFDWSPTGAEEASNNIFSVYCSEKILKIPRDEAHYELMAHKRMWRTKEYIYSGRNYTRDWSVWTALETYLQLQEAFGWEFFNRLLPMYNKALSSRPRNNQEVLDTWMVMSSQVAGYNLGPFYQGWGWPVSAGALLKVSTLPNWPYNPMPPSLSSSKITEKSQRSPSLESKEFEVEEGPGVATGDEENYGKLVRKYKKLMTLFRKVSGKIFHSGPISCFKGPAME